MKKVMMALKEPWRIVVWLNKYCIGHLIPDKIYLKVLYRGVFHTRLNIKNPKTFNEKLQWLKLHDRKSIYTLIADKYEAKKYVADIIGEEHIIPTLGVWSNFDEINIDALPSRFVLKCTHDSGNVVIVNDKKEFDKENARRKLVKGLETNYFWGEREWQYKDIKPRLMAEDHLWTLCGDQEIIDYKIYCFNGKPVYILVCTERFASTGLRFTFFDTEWNRMPFEWEGRPKSDKNLEKPQNLDKMLQIAEKLSANMNFLSVDLYSVGDRVFFGELTLHPGGGFNVFKSVEWDNIMGDLIDLSDK